MAQIVPGHSALVGRLIKALGINFPCEKLVLEMSVRSLVKLYVVAPACKDQLEGLAAALEEIQVIPCADVVVSDKGEVRYVPHNQPPGYTVKWEYKDGQ